MFGRGRIPIHRNILLLFVIQIGLATCVNLVWTFWPLFVQSLSANAFEVGLVWSIGGLTDAVLTLLISSFLDRIGRKKAVIISVCVTIISNLTFTFATNWIQLIPLRSLYVIWMTMYTPTRIVMVADITPPENRGRMYGLVFLAWPIGSIFSPFIGGYIIDHFGWNANFYTVILVGLLTLIPVMLLKETRIKVERRRKSSKKLGRRSLAPILIFTILNFIIAMGRNGLSQIIPFYLTMKFQVSKTQLGAFFSVGMMVMMLVTQIPGGRLADKYSRSKILLVCYGIVPLLYIMFPLVNDFNSLLILEMAINGLCLLAMPASTALIMDLTDEERKGMASALYMFGNTAGMNLVGPLAFGFIWEYLGPTAPFYTSTILFIMSIPVILLLERVSKSPQERVIEPKEKS